MSRKRGEGGLVRAGDLLSEIMPASLFDEVIRPEDVVGWCSRSGIRSSTAWRLRRSGCVGWMKGGVPRYGDGRQTAGASAGAERRVPDGSGAEPEPARRLRRGSHRLRAALYQFGDDEAGDEEAGEIDDELRREQGVGEVIPVHPRHAHAKGGEERQQGE